MVDLDQDDDPQPLLLKKGSLLLCACVRRPSFVDRMVLKNLLGHIKDAVRAS